MASLAVDTKWTFTGSTGSGKAYNLRGNAETLTWVVETSSGCTATVQLQHRMGSSAGPYKALSSVTNSTGDVNTDQMLGGGLEWVRPRLTDLTAGSTNIVTVYLKGSY